MNYKRIKDGNVFANEFIGSNVINEIFAKCLDILRRTYECERLKNSDDNNGPQCIEISIIDSIEDIAARILLSCEFIKRFADSRVGFVITDKGIKAFEEFNDYRTRVGL